MLIKFRKILIFILILIAFIVVISNEYYVYRISRREFQEIQTRLDSLDHRILELRTDKLWRELFNDSSMDYKNLRITNGEDCDGRKK